MEERTRVKKRLQPMTQSRAIFTLTVGGKKERSRATSETRGEKKQELNQGSLWKSVDRSCKKGIECKSLQSETDFIVLLASKV